MFGVNVTMFGAPLPLEVADNLIDVRVEESIHVPARIELRYADPYFQVFDLQVFKMGMPLEVTFLSDLGPMIYRAEITAVSLEQPSGARHELSILALGRGHRFAHRTTPRTFVYQTDFMMVQQIAATYGMAVIGTPTPLVHEYVLQTQDDYAFISDRARRLDYEWWVDELGLHFQPIVLPKPAKPLVWGENLRNFNVRYSAAEHVDAVVVQSWDPDLQMPIVSTSVATPADGLEASKTIASTAKATEAQASGSFIGVKIEGGQPVENIAEGMLLANAIKERRADEQVRVRGEADGNPMIRPGAMVQVVGVGISLSGSYTISSVEHVVGVGQPFLTRFRCGGSDQGTLVDMLQPDGPGGAKPAWGTDGLVIGKVLNNIDPLSLGRILVMFPSLSLLDLSAWARVVSPGGGFMRGFQALPEIGDEVVVGFEHGDYRRPFILGGVWSMINRPAEESLINVGPTGVINRVWRSKFGHTIELRDGVTPADAMLNITYLDRVTMLSFSMAGVTLVSPMPINIASLTDVSITAGVAINLNAPLIALNGAAITLTGAEIATTGTNVNIVGATTTIEGGVVSVAGMSTAAVVAPIVTIN